MADRKEKLPTWDLEAIYPDAEAWEKDFAKLEGLAEAFAAYRGKLGKSAKNLAAAMDADDKFSRLAEKLYVYAHLRADENTGDSPARARLDRVKAAFAELSP